MRRLSASRTSSMVVAGASALLVLCVRLLSSASSRDAAYDETLRSVRQVQLGMSRSTVGAIVRQPHGTAVDEIAGYHLEIWVFAAPTIESTAPQVTFDSEKDSVVAVTVTEEEGIVDEDYKARRISTP